MSPIVAAIISGVVCLGAGFLFGVIYRKKVGEAEIGSAEEQARKILEDGIKSAETKKKEALLEAKEEILKTKNEFELELKERRAELTRQERRAQSKEETLDRKTEALEKAREHIKPRLCPEARHIRRVDESGEADEICVRRLLRRLVNDFGVLPVRPREDERMRLRERARQPPVRLDEPRVVLPRMLDAGDVEDV